MDMNSLWSRKRVLVGVVALLAFGVGVAVYYGMRGDSEPPSAANGPGGPVAGSASSTKPSVAPEAPRPGVDKPFAVAKAYVDKSGRIINPNDCDGDGLPDDWEMRRYGTLKYDARTYPSAPRVDRVAATTRPEDSDGDSLPDAWERKHFGHLRFGRQDDPDEDGYPNYVEYHRSRLGERFDPTRPDLLAPARKPDQLRADRSAVGRPFSTDTVEFWRKQDALRKKRQAAETAASPGEARAAASKDNETGAQE